MNKPLPFLVKLALVLFSMISLGYLLMLGKTLFAPMFFSFLIALLLLPFAKFFEKRCRFKRSLATVTSVLLMLIICSAVIAFFSNQVKSFTNDWPLLQQQGQLAFHNAQEWVAQKFHINFSKQWNYINQGIDKLFSTSATIVGTTLSTVSSTFIFLTFTLLFTFFILNYRRVLYAFLISVFSDDHKERVEEIVNNVKSIIKKYITGLLIEMLIVSLALIIILSLLGVKYSVLLGFMGGVFNVIPYLGIFTALLLSSLVTFATVGSGKVLLVVIAFIVVHAIDSNLVMPLVVGSKVKLNPMIAFIGIIVGEMLWGISGMFLCIPFLAIIKIIFDRVPGLHAWGILMGEEGALEGGKQRLPVTKKQ
ncbi:AI-2E family transporter [Niabella soli]|uniref:Permease n=1 Tax=Niabella soli DSM 19437 TaxID=929713 RepID=W0EUQ8_9BACT|nr:AI-2E family transporter [Niabella soli]AHF14545.1 permease [Niabella soli DSM 19437]